MNEQPTLSDILVAIDGIRQDAAETNHRIDETNHQVAESMAEQSRRWAMQETESPIILERIDTYQKSSAQVVNLAFALIGAATVALVGIVLRLAVSL